MCACGEGDGEGVGYGIMRLRCLDGGGRAFRVAARIRRGAMGRLVQNTIDIALYGLRNGAHSVGG